ncbi:MAG: nucleoside phosphorylase [Chloroflexota bacterium]
MTLKELPITGLPVGGVSPSVLVCGDPARADRIAVALDDSRLLSEKREYRAYQGSFHGVPVTVCSHGVGAPGSAVAFEELIAAGAQRIIRVGTCGGMQPDIQAGQLVIATAAVQHTGLGRELAPAGYPAAADPDVTIALRTTAEQHGMPTQSGYVLTRDAFYAGVQTADIPDYKVLSQAHVLAVEMECAALFLIGALRGIPTGAILTVDGNVLVQTESMESYQPDRAIVQAGVEAAIQIALEALRGLA